MVQLRHVFSDSVTFHPISMFKPDIHANAKKLTRELKGKKVCVIGGASSIGASIIKAVLRFELASGVAHLNPTVCDWYYSLSRCS